ncbi:hypothetical protein SAMN05421595_1151 [Austwickia chelonae]|uniref:DUF6318 domain-containing protein n=1 Tax=Austwickia chelonae NBRC 105200 TaxID=1184607 RepID=K6VKQ4_9MICO|nr:DUF6318 family protein [Austwickia chelonae]GAB77324.1 hypothetical protein AUCHE_05_02290 [Austwickia chelonae NBRC 105200]SEW07811.1 hypothetical protein SAMN05421595_1151 [Austwickia chelonae]
MSSTTESYDVLAALPTGAKEENQRGSEEFARYFFLSVSRALENPAPGQLPRLCLPGVKSCLRFDEDIATLAKAEQHVSGPELDVLSTECVLYKSKTQVNTQVVVKVRFGATQKVDRNGRTIGQWSTPGTRQYLTYLQWTEESWRVESIKILPGASES